MKIIISSSTFRVLGRLPTLSGNFYSNPSEYVGTRANTDSETAFMQAIMWYITGDETYRANAMDIIRKYSAIQ